MRLINPPPQEVPLLAASNTSYSVRYTDDLLLLQAVRIPMTVDSLFRRMYCGAVSLSAIYQTILFFCFCLAATYCSTLRADSKTAADSSSTGSGGRNQLVFAPYTADAVFSELDEWVIRQKVTEPALSRIREIRDSAVPAGNVSAGESLLDCVIDCLSTADLRIHSFTESLQKSEDPEPPMLQYESGSQFLDECVQLYRARWLTQHRYYDEALEILAALTPEKCIDPASLFFYRAVCQQALNQHNAAQDSLTLLLESTVGTASRFRTLAEMMRSESGHAEPEGLPAAAQVMADVRRRLELGRSGKKVQQQEEQVIAILDKLLQDMEQNNQQKESGEGGGGSGNGQGGSATPAGSSGISGSTAKGEADRKELKESGSWGMLDKKMESRARDLIRQQFPSNYLDAISRYTRKIAEQK